MCGRRKGKGSSSELITTLRTSGRSPAEGRGRGAEERRHLEPGKTSEGGTGLSVGLDHRGLDLRCPVEVYNANTPMSFQ